MTFEDIPGWFDWEPAYIEAVTRLDRFRYSTVVEVGCYLGRSLANLAGHVVASGKACRVIGVDTCRGSGVEVNAGGSSDYHAAAVADGGGTLAGQLHRNLIACGVADVVDLLVAPSVRAAQYFADASLDFVFLDAAHDETSVRADIRAWLPKVRPGGVLAGDDYTPVWPGVMAAVRDLLPGFQTRPHDAWWYEVK